MAAGLPLLQQASPGSTVAVDALVRGTGAGLLYADADDLAAGLTDARLGAARRAVAAVRERFTFDAHVDDLLALLRTVCDG